MNSTGQQPQSMKHHCPDSFGEATPPLRTEVTKRETDSTTPGQKAGDVNLVKEVIPGKDIKNILRSQAGRLVCIVIYEWAFWTNHQESMKK